MCVTIHLITPTVRFFSLVTLLYVIITLVNTPNVTKTKSCKSGVEKHKEQKSKYTKNKNPEISFHEFPVKSNFTVYLIHSPVAIATCIWPNAPHSTHNITVHIYQQWKNLSVLIHCMYRIYNENNRHHPHSRCRTENHFNLYCTTVHIYMERLLCV